MYNFSSIESMIDEFSMMFNHFKSELFDSLIKFLEQINSSEVIFDIEKCYALFSSLSN